MIVTTAIIGSSPRFSLKALRYSQDVYRPRQPEDKPEQTAGYIEPETTGFANTVNSPGDDDVDKFADMWRKLHPDDHRYTHFSFRFNFRKNGYGNPLP